MEIYQHFRSNFSTVSLNLIRFTHSGLTFKEEKIDLRWFDKPNNDTYKIGWKNDEKNTAPYYYTESIFIRNSAAKSISHVYHGHVGRFIAERSRFSVDSSNRKYN